MGIPNPIPLTILFNSEKNHYNISSVGEAQGYIDMDISNNYRVVLSMTPTEFKAMYRKINGMQIGLF